MHLFFPLLASILFVIGLIFIKRAGACGIGPVTTLFAVNQCTMLAFLGLWFLGGTMQPWSMAWQPAIIAALFIMGLAFTFLAIERGDVSIAAPIFGVKVVFVALLLTQLSTERLPIAVWYAVILASLGIALIQWTGTGRPRHVIMTISSALAAAFSYALFDVLVQRWAPAWGAGRFLPIAFLFVGLFSLAMVPWVQWRKMIAPSVRRNLFPGAVLIALQAIGIILTIAMFGDAARINVVYALRGLWGVLIAWGVAKTFGGSEALLSPATMLTRSAGAALLTVAVWLAIR
jgi:drug/metabolite transporter (DMT)-like permease